MKAVAGLRGVVELPSDATTEDIRGLHIALNERGDCAVTFDDGGEARFTVAIPEVGACAPEPWVADVLDEAGFDGIQYLAVCHVLVALDAWRYTVAQIEEAGFTAPDVPEVEMARSGDRA